jgi:hypothetical protein
VDESRVSNHMFLFLAIANDFLQSTSQGLRSPLSYIQAHLGHSISWASTLRYTTDDARRISSFSALYIFPLRSLSDG